MQIRKRYNYVPPCPRCGSNATGYIVNKMSKKEGYEEVYNAMLRGELIEIELGFGLEAENDNNIFCTECGSRYHGKVFSKRLTYEEMLEQRNLRNITDEKLEEYAVIFLPWSKRRKLVKEQKKARKLQEEQSKQTKEVKVKTAKAKPEKERKKKHKIRIKGE